MQPRVVALLSGAHAVANTGQDISVLGKAFALIHELELNPCLVNVHGGAIALGHPIGASGCIITLKLINEMVSRKSKYGMATLCIGGGQGLAVLFELC